MLGIIIPFLPFILIAMVIVLIIAIIVAIVFGIMAIIGGLGIAAVDTAVKGTTAIVATKKACDYMDMGQDLCKKAFGEDEEEPKDYRPKWSKFD